MFCVEAVVVQESATTGGRGNPAYLAELQATEAGVSTLVTCDIYIIMPLPPTGPSMQTDQTYRQCTYPFAVEQQSVVQSGGTGNPTYEAELRRAELITAAKAGIVGIVGL